MPTKPKKPAAAKKAKKSKSVATQKRRYWLMYPANEVTNPVIWELSQKYSVMTNVRQASVTGDLGIVCLEIEGERDQMKKAITWLEKQGISVEPVEINVIES